MAQLAADDVSPTAATMRTMVQSHRDWVRANHTRAALRLAWKEFFRDVDVLLCPQMATTAFPHDHSPADGRTLLVDGEPRPYFEQVFWAGLVTVAYLPSTVFPTGPGAEGLPIGLQAVSGEFEDRTCIEFARLMAEELGGFLPPPACAD